MTYQISDKKERTFVAFVVAGVTALSLPLIFNHISHIDGIIHLTVHAGGFVLASFLTVVALISWRKTKIARMIFSGFAFAVLAVAYLKATSAENLLSKAFSGPQWRMIFLAAFLEFQLAIHYYSTLKLHRDFLEIQL